MTNLSPVSVTEAKTPGGIFFRKTQTPTSKATLALIMGYGGSLRIWPTSFIETLAQKYVVITYDNRGTGLSVIPERSEDYSVKSMSEDFAEVLHVVGSKSHHVLGYSMGSCIALQYAHENQASVRSLFLMCGTAGGALFVKPEKEMSNALANPQGASLWDIYVSTWKLMFAPEALERCRPKFEQIYENSKLLPTKLVALAGHSHAFRGFDGSEFIADLEIPTTILAGADDRLMPVDNSKNLANHIAASRLILIDNCEHGPHVQDEELVLEAIESTCNGADAKLPV
jgi:pimeloyl-ACP methyl ester carboxylesterase